MRPLSLTFIRMKLYQYLVLRALLDDIFIVTLGAFIDVEHWGAGMIKCWIQSFVFQLTFFFGLLWYLSEISICLVVLFFIALYGEIQFKFVSFRTLYLFACSFSRPVILKLTFHFICLFLPLYLAPTGMFVQPIFPICRQYLQVIFVHCA